GDKHSDNCFPISYNSRISSPIANNYISCLYDHRLVCSYYCKETDNALTRWLVPKLVKNGHKLFLLFNSMDVSDLNAYLNLQPSDKIGFLTTFDHFRNMHALPKIN